MMMGKETGCIAWLIAFLLFLSFEWHSDGFGLYSTITPTYENEHDDL